MACFDGYKRLGFKWIAAGLSLYLASCGTLLHPERRGQPAGRLDPGIVVLDAVGLLFFFIPGVIAFAVDFSNGTIYLPPERSASSSQSSDPLRTIHVDPNELTRQRLEAALQEQTGRPVQLEAGAYRATKLTHIDQFSATTIQGLQSDSTATSVVFRGSSK